MKISIVGSGYVGLTAAAGFCKLNHTVICFDVDENKVNQIKSGNIPIYEPGVQEILKESAEKGRFSITTDLQHTISNTEITFIAVPTPEMKNGCQDTKYINAASKDIGKALKSKVGYHLVVVKSTVLPETTSAVVIPNLESSSGKKAGEGFGVAMNPEFLREGSALKDFLEPDRIIIGELDERSGDLLEQSYKGIRTVFIRTDLKTAEMIKYASNTFLAAKVTLSNEIGNICKKLGIDAYEVMKGVGSDKRIAPYFLRSGIGFGGSCFKKDMSALICKSDSIGYDAKVMKEIISTNKNQPLKIVDLLKKKMGSMKGKRICILGVSFKGGTDDIRESPVIAIAVELIRNGAHLNVYDPHAAGNFSKIFPDALYFNSAKDCIKGADACLVLAEWDEFRGLTDADFSTMKTKIIIEGRRILNPNNVTGFEGVCW